MGRVRIVSNRVVRPGHVLTRGDLWDGPDVELQLLVRSGSAEWVDGETRSAPEPTVSDEPAADALFASGAAAEAATAEGLTAADFDGVDPSGKTGFTKADVEAIAQAKE